MQLQRYVRSVDKSGSEISPVESKDDSLRKIRQSVHELLSFKAQTDFRFPPRFCELDLDSGILCPGIKRGIYLDQFYYDAASNRCGHFIYNGCGIIQFNQLYLGLHERSVISNFMLFFSDGQEETRIDSQACGNVPNFVENILGT